jgi:hypothetical protein
MPERPLTINHAELVYPNGGKEAARATLELLGLTVTEGGPWLVAVLDPETANYCDDIIFASEATPAQLAFEDAFAEAVASNPELAAKLSHYQDVRRTHPQFPFHFGISVPTHAEWQRRVSQIEEASREHPLLAGKIEVYAFEPGDPGAITYLSQGFVRTTALAGELLALGLQIELQWTPLDEDGNPPYGLIEDQMPDLASLS